MERSGFVQAKPTQYLGTLNEELLNMFLTNYIMELCLPALQKLYVRYRFSKEAGMKTHYLRGSQYKRLIKRKGVTYKDWCYLQFWYPKELQQ